MLLEGLIGGGKGGECLVEGLSEVKIEDEVGLGLWDYIGMVRS
jgi:hypothetical protein